MIKVIYDSGSNPDEPNAPAHEEVFDTQSNADEFMSTVREHGGTIIEWYEMTDSEAINHNIAVHQPHGF